MRYLAILLATIMSAPATAQEADTGFVSDIAYSQIDEHNYRGALKIVGQELEQCVPRRGEKACLKLALRLAEASLFGFDYRRSQQFAERALALTERHRPPGHEDHAAATFFLGKALLQAGRIERAEPLLRRALTLAEALPDPDPAMLAQRYSLIGELLDEQLRFADAYPFHERAMQILRPISADEPSLYLTLAMNWAYSLALIGEVETAESILRDVVPDGVMPASFSPELAKGQYLLALILLDRGETDEALDRATKAAMGMGEKQVGESLPSAIRPIRLQGEIMAAKGWDDGARRHFVEALLLARKYLPETGRDRINAAVYFARYLLEDIDRLAEARTLIREAASGAIARSVQTRDPGVAELREYRGVFIDQVETAWRLANR